MSSIQHLGPKDWVWTDGLLVKVCIRRWWTMKEEERGGSYENRFFLSIYVKIFIFVLVISFFRERSSLVTIVN